MFQKLVSRNDDLRRLVEQGYAVGVDGGYLIVRDIPYLDSSRVVQRGAFVTKFVQRDADQIEQEDHQVFFAGGVPHQIDGTPIPNLGGGPTSLPLSASSDDVRVERSFSVKPRVQQRYADFCEKIATYTAIIAGPAMQVSNCTPYTFRVVDGGDPPSVFTYRDTLTSRAELTDLAERFAQDVVAVIGLGGTGAYLLDLLVKTPVAEIRGFDPDVFHVHTAFRSPGRLTETGELGQLKADVYHQRYAGFRRGITCRSVRIDAGSAAELAGVTFAFVCVDSGPARAEIVQLLDDLRIPFIDVGLGVRRERTILNGQLRTTYFPAGQAQRVREQGWVELAADPNDEYKVSIQIAELNALNASLAVVRFKQLRGFYASDSDWLHAIFEIDSNTVFTVDKVEENSQ